ncbi:Zinc finger, C2H2 domain-containing protein [Strongyloides ratti]|uniref:Zinc finger, C2H2 domain-containing protein n=1 Tax=Strongyloides ratti TaxID=34506 RepID=A0A090MP49_STRRB|nr:Zinc finger, C2H2 domain-containing protein [Strongyloides ratti]CEF59866.1 Zinc finger, C2H2 domain-containing protein [Strongyloides ratti]
MVSTTSQYLTEFTTPIVNNSAETGKSPLAMLAKTCETIGLADNSPPRKNNINNNNNTNSFSEYTSSSSSVSPRNSTKISISPKDENNYNSTNSNLVNLKPKPITTINDNKILSPAPTPKRNPIISQFNPMFLQHQQQQQPNPNDSMTAAALAAMAQAQFVNPMMRFPPVMPGSPFPGAMNGAIFNMPHMMPGGMMQAMPNQMDMMNLFALQAQAAAYNAQNPFLGGMMPQTNQLPNNTSATAIQAYQSLMAAAAGQTEKNICSWSDGSGICGKVFPTPDLLTQHMKSHLPDLRNSQTPTIPTTSSNNTKKSTSASPATSVDGTRKSTKSSRNSPIVTPILPPTNLQNQTGGLRFHPYMKNSMIRNNNHQSMKLPSVDQNVQAALNAATIQAFINSQKLMTGSTSQ